MSRSRAWRRWKNYMKARRKRLIDWSYAWTPEPKLSNPLDFTKRCGFYTNLHQYSKNKIHCSCPICAAKTKNKGGRRMIWAPSYNPTMMDKRRADAMDANEFDFFENL